MNYGKFFGYPECCIEAFGFKIPYFMRSNLVQEANKKMSLELGENTGYIPCEECAKRIMNEETSIIVEEINSRRLAILPFPHQHKDDEAKFDSL